MSANSVLMADNDVSADTSVDTDAVGRLRTAYQFLHAASTFANCYGTDTAFTLADVQSTVHVVLGDWLNDLEMLIWLADALRILAKAHRGEVALPIALQSAAMRLHQALSQVTPKDAEPPPEDQWQPQRLRLADDLYLVAHDDVSGAPRLSSPRVMGLGLAGALLAELATDDHIGVENGIVVGFDDAAPRDALGHEVHDQIMGERLAVHDWLTYFSQSATSRVAERLGRSGALVLRSSRIPLRPGRWVPSNPNKAVMPVVNLVTPLMRRRPLSEHYATLGGLVEAMGLGSHERVLWEVRQGAPDCLAALTAAVGALKPSVRELIAYTERAVASAFVTHRA